MTFLFPDVLLLSSQMERDGEFDQEGLELTCLDLFKVLVIIFTNTLVVISVINISTINIDIDL